MHLGIVVATAVSVLRYNEDMTVSGTVYFKQVRTPYHNQTTPMSPQLSYPAIQGWLATLWIPLICCMAGRAALRASISGADRVQFVWGPL